MANETMTLIASATVTGSPSDISLTSIPQTYTDLQILISSTARTTANPNSLVIFVNGYAQTSKGYKFFRGNGSTASTGGSTENIVGDLTNISTTFGSQSIYIANYISATLKSVSADSVTENNGTTAYASIWANKFDSAAITSIQFGDGSAGGGLGVGTQVWLYGIKKGSGGATIS